MYNLFLDLFLDDNYLKVFNKKYNLNKELLWPLDKCLSIRGVYYNGSTITVVLYYYNGTMMVVL